MTVIELFEKSYLYKNFEAILNDADISIISCDIFETLVFRHVDQPIDIFYRVGQDPYVLKRFNTPEAFKKFRVEAEKKARRVYQERAEITLECIYDQLPLNDEEKIYISSLELDTEFKSIYINPHIEYFLNTAIQKDKKVIFISDMYLSTQQLKRLVFSKLSFEVSDSDIFISSEYNMSKSRGDIYQYILNLHHIDSNQICHIGDNARADIENAKRLGIRTIHYQLSPWLHETLQIEAKYIQEKLGAIQSLRVAAGLTNPFLTDKEQFYFNYGAVFIGPVLWSFVHWLKHIATTEGIKQINFIMREGRIFKKLFSKIVDHNDYETNLIYASRESTFLSSLEYLSLLKEGFNFYNFRELTIKDIYTIFKLEMNDLHIQNHKDRTYAEAATIDISGISLQEYLHSDFANHLKEIEIILEKERTNLKTYLKQTSICRDSIFLDFGGTGRIFERFHSIMEGTFKLQILFYMHEIGYAHNVSQKTFSFLPNTLRTERAIEIIRRSPEFLEILFNGAESTTVAYEEQNEQIQPVQKFPHDNLEETKIIDNAFQAGIDAFFTLALHHDFTMTLTNESSALLLARCIDVPSAEEVTYLGNLIQDEGNGNEKLYQLIDPITIEDIRKEGIEHHYLKFCNNLWYRRDDVLWFQGVITAINPTYISTLKNLNVKKQNEQAIENILAMIEELGDIGSVIIYGAGIFFKELLPFLKERNIAIEGVIDSRASHQSFECDGYQVGSIHLLNHLNLNCPIIICSAVYDVEILSLLIKYAENNKYNFHIISHTQSIRTKTTANVLNTLI